MMQNSVFFKCNYWKGSYLMRTLQELKCILYCESLPYRYIYITLYNWRL